MALPDAQKGFYDSRRYFQGRDNPDAPPAPAPAAASGIPVPQLVVGVIFLALIALAFFAFALPKPEVAPAEHGAPPAAAQPVQPAAH
ncbi:MAG TPA: hypothetical protein VH877_18990 [Polyangia bacterium]|jgi:hypothetical protein|nr:hypothetical protein [Polyangia bacterium]